MIQQLLKLGPMVYALSYCAIEKKEKLKSLGFADSKTLKEEDRERLFESLNASGFIGWGVYASLASEISESMLRKCVCKTSHFTDQSIT